MPGGTVDPSRTVTDLNPAASDIPLVGRSGEVAVLDEAVRAPPRPLRGRDRRRGGDRQDDPARAPRRLRERRGGRLVLSARCSEYERDVPVRAADRRARPAPGRARRRRPGVDLAALGDDVPGAARRTRAAPRRSATSCTAPSARCSSGSPRRAASSCSSTTCTGPTRRRSRSSPRSCAARRRAAAARRRAPASPGRLRAGPRAAPGRRRGPRAPPGARAADARRRRRSLLAGRRTGELRRLLRGERRQPVSPDAARRAPRRRRSRAPSDPGHAEVPGGVREAVLSETAPLPTDARALLDGAAIVGDPFEIDFAAEVAGLDARRGAGRAGRARGRGPRPRHRRGAALPLPPSDRPPHRLRDGRSRPAAGRARARRGRPGARRAPDRSRSPTTSSSRPRRATPPPSRCSPRRRPRSPAARRRPPCTGSRSRERSCRARRAAGGAAARPAGGCARGRRALRRRPPRAAGAAEPLPRIPGAHGADRRAARRWTGCSATTTAAGAPARRARGARRCRARTTRSRSTSSSPRTRRCAATRWRCARAPREALAGRGTRRPRADGRRDRRAGDGRLHARRRTTRRARAGARRRRWSPGSTTSSSARGWRCCSSSAGRSSSCGEFALALEHFTRGTAIARRAGSAVLALELMVGEALGLLARGRIAEALDVADGAVEDARPLGSAQSLVWALYAQATVLEAGGDAGRGGAGGGGGGRADRGARAVLDRRRVRLGAGRGARRHRRGAAGGQRPARAAGRPGPAALLRRPARPGATRCSSARRC